MEIKTGNKLIYGDGTQMKPASSDRRNIVNAQPSADGSMSVVGFKVPAPINFNTEEMRGSMQFILSENIGEYVLIEFLIGTNDIVRKQGILYFVGTSYVTLYDNQENNFILCDIFSIKFVYFYFPGDRPASNFNIITSDGIKNQGRGITQKRGM